MSRASKIHIPIDLSFDWLDKTGSLYLKGKAVRENLVIDQIKFNSVEGNLIISMVVSGTYSGTLRMSTKPRIREGRKGIDLENLNLQLGEKSRFSKGISWVLNRMFGSNLESRIEEMLNRQILLLIGDLTTRTHQHGLDDGIQLTADVMEILFTTIEVHTDSLHIEAEIELVLKAHA